MKAVEVITAAYEDLNRLSPGEPLSADDAAFGLRRLNRLVDEIAGGGALLFQDVLTAAAQTGNITMGSAPWAALAPGSRVISAMCDMVPLRRLTMQQYHATLRFSGDSGTPGFYAQDGLQTVYFIGQPAGQTISLQTRQSVPEFANQETDYLAPRGYKAYLSAALAVRIAPTLLGSIPDGLLRAERRCKGGLARPEPAIVDVHSFAMARGDVPGMTGAGNVIDGPDVLVF